MFCYELYMLFLFTIRYLISYLQPKGYNQGFLK